MKLYDELKWRGMIQDVSSPEVEKMIKQNLLQQKQHEAFDAKAMELRSKYMA